MSFLNGISEAAWWQKGDRQNALFFVKDSHLLADNWTTEIVAQRSSKGTVKVIEDKGWLRLRWSFGGRRYTLAMGLSDTPTNRLVAERKAKTIETDLVLEQFDSTLAISPAK